MAKYASGKKSQAISDRSGLKVPYTDLKTTWDGLRVSPEDWEPKHPQLTPAKNVVDATALFNPRPDTDPENVDIFIGYNFDPFIDPRQRPGVGVHGQGAIGFSTLLINSNINETGVAGTGALGTYTLFVTTDIPVSGASGTGAIGDEVLELELTESGVSGTGAIGDEALETDANSSGIAGTGALGSDTLEVELGETGVAGIGEVEGFGISGNGNIQLLVTGISGIGATGAIGEEVSASEAIETGVSGAGAIGTSQIEVNFGWGQDVWGSGSWGE